MYNMRVGEGYDTVRVCVRLRVLWNIFLFCVMPVYSVLFFYNLPSLYQLTAVHSKHADTYKQTVAVTYSPMYTRSTGTVVETEHKIFFQLFLPFPTYRSGRTKGAAIPSPLHTSFASHTLLPA